MTADAATVLVIDDEPSLLLSLQVLLQRAGYQVLTAGNGKEGLARVRERAPSVILCDVMMPPPNGLELRRLLAQDPATADIPFIFVTARTGQPDRLAGFGLGADDYVTKPFNRDELLARIAAVLRRNELGRQQGWREAQAEIDRLKQSISAHLHSTLRVPLNNVIGMLELALKTRFGHNQEELHWFVERAHDNAVYLQGMIEDMLLLGALDRHADEVRHRQRVDLETQLRGSAARAAQRRPEVPVTLSVEIAPGVELWAPPDAFARAVEHLVDNAAKFSPPGGIVRVQVAANGPGGVLLTVSDDGPGIPRLMREMVFHRYCQPVVTHPGTQVSLGVGLAIVRELARGLGGDTEIVDSPRGCVVRVAIPPLPDTAGAGV